MSDRSRFIFINTCLLVIFCILIYGCSGGSGGWSNNQNGQQTSAFSLKMSFIGPPSMSISGQVPPDAKGTVNIRVINKKSGSAVLEKNADYQTGSITVENTIPGGDTYSVLIIASLSYNASGSLPANSVWEGSSEVYVKTNSEISASGQISEVIVSLLLKSFQYVSGSEPNTTLAGYITDSAAAPAVASPVARGIATGRNVFIDAEGKRYSSTTDAEGFFDVDIRLNSASATTVISFVSQSGKAVTAEVAVSRGSVSAASIDVATSGTVSSTVKSIGSFTSTLNVATLKNNITQSLNQNPPTFVSAAFLSEKNIRLTFSEKVAVSGTVMSKIYINGNQLGASDLILQDVSDTSGKTAILTVSSIAFSQSEQANGISGATPSDGIAIAAGSNIKNPFGNETAATSGVKPVSKDVNPPAAPTSAQAASAFSFNNELRNITAASSIIYPESCKLEVVFSGSAPTTSTAAQYSESSFVISHNASDVVISGIAPQPTGIGVYYRFTDRAGNSSPWVTGSSVPLILNSFAFTSNSPQTAGSPITLTVTAKDVNSSTVTSYLGSGTLSIAGTTGAITWSGTGITDGADPGGAFSSAAFTNGVATVQLTNTAMDSNKVVTITDSASSKTGTVEVSWNASGTVAAPVFSPVSGTYNSALTVSITCATPGASIKYTTNGSTPNNGILYSGPVAVSGNTTFNAYAVKTGMNDSPVSTASYSFDSIRPSAIISSTAPNPTNASPIPMTVSFNESVSGFTLSDISITNGSPANLISLSSMTYTFDVVPSSDGSVAAQIPASAVADIAGNANVASPSFAISFKATRPSVAIASNSANPTGTSPIPMSASFSESVSGFGPGDIALTNGSILAFTTLSASSYAFDVTPAGQGAVICNIGASVAFDVAGNPNFAAAPYAINYDSVSPAATLATSSASPTKVSPIPVTASFSETVTGFGPAAISITNGTAANFATLSTTSYTFDVAAQGAGTVIISIIPGSIRDLAGNASAANQLSVIYDNVAPSASISSTSPNPTDSSPLFMTAVFSENVSGFSSSGISVTNGAVNNFISASPNTYTFNVIPAAQGTVVVNIGPSVASDPVGNQNTPAQFSLYYDTAPAMSISTTSSSPTNSSPIPVTASFSEAVSGLSLSGISVINGTAQNLATLSGQTYTFDINPSSSLCLINIGVNQSAAFDAFGHGSPASNQISISYDNIKPTVWLSSTSPNPTNSSPVPLTASFSEAVSGLTIGEITVTNGTASNFTPVSSQTYTFDVTPASNGTVIVTISQSVASDQAGNANQTSNQFSVIYESSSPAPTLSSTASNPTNASPIPMKASFNENVTGFTIGDITVGNATASNFSSLSAMTYTFDIMPASSLCSITVSIGASMLSDLVGNPNSASNQFSITYDSISPTAIVSSTAPTNPTNLSPIPMKVSFSESVTGFTVPGINVTNGSVSNLASLSAQTYTFDVTPSSAGSVAVNIFASAASDNAGNLNTASPQFSINYDNSIPSAVISSTAANPTASSPIPVKAVFNEQVNGFTSGDLTLANATASNFSSIGGITYTFDLTPSSSFCTVLVNINASVATDIAGNQNAPSSQFSIQYDSQITTVILSTSLSDPTNISPIPITASFSESITGFSLDDITVANGTASNLYTVSSMTYTFDVTPAGNGMVSIDIGASAVVDASGNPNSDPGPLTITYDSTPPSSQVVLMSSNPTNTSPIPMKAQFSEAVSGFSVAGLSIVNGTASNISTVSASTYTFDVVPSSNGSVTANITASAVYDLAGNSNPAASNLVTVVYDSVSPAIILSSTASSPTATSPIPVKAVFSEAVTGFDLADITPANAAASNFSSIGGITYTFDLTPSSSFCTVSFGINASVASDSAGNGNTASSQFSIVYDKLSPTGNFTATYNPTNSSPIPMTVSFSETVVGFSIGNISISNGSPSNFSSLSGQTYTFDILPSAEGSIFVSVAASLFNDAAGNWNAAIPQYTVIYDLTSPNLSFSTTASNPTNQSPIPVKATFSESVSGFAIGDISVTNGTAMNFSSLSGQTYTFDVTPAGSGTVTINAIASAAQDLAGNWNNPPAQLSVNYDTVSPDVYISTTAPNPTKGSPIPLKATFSESVSGFAIGDISVTNGTAGNLTSLSAMTYTFDITPSSSLCTVLVDIGASVANDAAGNINNAASQFSIKYDSIQPTGVITSSKNPTNESPIPMTVTFSESVSGLTIGGLYISNGTASNISTISANTYTFDVTPSGEGTVYTEIYASAVTDTAGNGNIAVPQYTVTYDNTSPSLAFSTAISSPTKSSPVPVTATFSESVSGFNISGLSLTNCAASNFSTVSGQTYTFDITPSGQGTFVINANNSAARDSAGNWNSAPTPIQIIYDTVRPDVSITSTEPNPTTASPIPMTATFSENVAGFSTSDLVIGNGTVTNFTTLSGTVYTFNVTPSATTVTVTADINASAAFDYSGNGNMPAPQFTIKKE